MAFFLEDREPREAAFLNTEGFFQSCLSMTTPKPHSASESYHLNTSKIS